MNKTPLKSKGLSFPKGMREYQRFTKFYVCFFGTFRNVPTRITPENSQIHRVFGRERSEGVFSHHLGENQREFCGIPFILRTHSYRLTLI